MVYAAEHLSLAVLEVLVHVQDRSKLADYRLVTINIPDGLIATIGTDALGEAWQHDLNLTRSLGKAWLDAGHSAAILVPSVIIAGERNVLINPRHPDAARLTAAEPVTFRFDPRLLG